MKSKSTWYVIVFVIAVALLLSWNRISPAPAAAPITDPTTLAGIQTGPAPWKPEIAHLAQRLTALGLPALSAEGTAMHIHQHLDIFVDGAPVAVPAEIGINNAQHFISDIHVHDDRGVIHVEASRVQMFTLGQVFDIWGVRFTSQCIGTYCASGDTTLKVYSNGALYQGDPRLLPLTPHEEIAVIFGTATDSPKTVPSSYSFQPGE